MKKQGALLAALAKLADERNIDEVNLVLHVIKQTRFCRGFSRDVQNLLANAARLFSFEHEQILFQQGDTGDMFYIILSGQVVVYQGRRDKKGMPSKSQILATLYSGASFGELALLSESDRRTASCISQEHSLLVGIPKGETVYAIHTCKNADVMREFLNTVPVLKMLNTKELEYVAKKFIAKSFLSTHSVLKSGEKSKGLYIVVDGNCEVVETRKGKSHVLKSIWRKDHFGGHCMNSQIVDPENGLKNITAGTIVCKSNVSILFLPIQDLYECTPFRFREFIRTSQQKQN